MFLSLSRKGFIVVVIPPFFFHVSAQPLLNDPLHNLVNYFSLFFSFTGTHFVTSSKFSFFSSFVRFSYTSLALFCFFLYFLFIYLSGVYFCPTTLLTYFHFFNIPVLYTVAFLLSPLIDFVPLRFFSVVSFFNHLLLHSYPNYFVFRSIFFNKQHELNFSIYLLSFSLLFVLRFLSTKI